MPTRSARFLATTLALCLHAPVLHAQDSDADQNENHIAVGAGFVDQHTPFKLEPTQTNLIPFVSIRQGAYYFEGLETGVHLAADQGDSAVSLDLFVVARSPSGRDRQKLTADAGARVSLETGLGVLSGEVRHDATDTFNGSEVIARYRYSLTIGRVTIAPALQASWLDRKTANHMYGVTAAQRSKMIRKQRKVILPVAPILDDALNLGGDLSIAVQLDQRLTVVGMVGGTWLDQSIHRSAAIEQEWEAQSALGLTYRF